MEYFFGGAPSVASDRRAQRRNLQKEYQAVVAGLKPKTRGGLTRDDLALGSTGRIVSKKRQQAVERAAQSDMGVAWRQVCDDVRAQYPAGTHQSIVMRAASDKWRIIKQDLLDNHDYDEPTYGSRKAKTWTYTPPAPKRKPAAPKKAAVPARKKASSALASGSLFGLPRGPVLGPVGWPKKPAAKKPAAKKPATFGSSQQCYALAKRICQGL
jgi:hypothetical protein